MDGHAALGDVQARGRVRVFFVAHAEAGAQGLEAGQRRFHPEGASAREGARVAAGVDEDLAACQADHAAQQGEIHLHQRVRCQVQAAAVGQQGAAALTDGRVQRDLLARCSPAPSHGSQQQGSGAQEQQPLQACAPASRRTWTSGPQHAVGQSRLAGGQGELGLHSLDLLPGLFVRGVAAAPCLAGGAVGIGGRAGGQPHGPGNGLFQRLGGLVCAHAVSSLRRARQWRMAVAMYFSTELRHTPSCRAISG